MGHLFLVVLITCEGDLKFLFKKSETLKFEQPGFFSGVASAH